MILVSADQGHSPLSNGILVSSKTFFGLILWTLKTGSSFFLYGLYMETNTKKCYNCIFKAAHINGFWCDSSRS